MGTGSCCCGAVRIEARDEPVRVGLCHCTTCRKQSGSAVTANAIWRAEDVTIHGETRSWKDTTVSRHFCPVCGSSLFGISDGEIAIETEAAQRMVLRLAREEGLLVGVSSGANMLAAVKVARQAMEAGHPAPVVVTIFCDSAAKYLSEEFWHEVGHEAENWP